MTVILFTFALFPNEPSSFVFLLNITTLTHRSLEAYLAQDVDGFTLFKGQFVFIRGIESKQDLTVLFC